MTSGKKKDEDLAPQLQLPFWPDHTRGVPTAALFSALFAPIRKGARQAVERERIASIASYKITYSGFRLDQADLDVFEHVLHMFRIGQSASLGTAVRFSTREMLKAIGRAQGKANREWLMKSLTRLQGGVVEIAKEGKVYSGTLIQDIVRDEKTGAMAIVLNPRMLALFDQGYGQIVWKQRQLLAGKPLAQWLHGFVASQQRALTFKITDLMSYAASSYGRERDFRTAVDEAAISIRNAGLDLVVLWDLDRGTATLTRSSWKSATAVPPPGV